MPDALARLCRLLPGLPHGAPLARFLPPPGEGGRDRLQRRAALASTLLAGLELARDGAAALDQDAAFGPIQLRARPPEVGITVNLAPEQAA
ncbi:hypothetical protein KSF81_27295 [Siccirubricoccus sp. G192]|nr:hypothetical protein [Siccirubricoccus sp. G192]